jgi:hypothetical protein
MKKSDMSKLAFLLYYSGLVGLLAAYTVKELWLGRISLILIVSGCWLHAKLWRQLIESITESVPTLVAALDLLNKHREQMDVFVRLMPNLFSSYLLPVQQPKNSSLNSLRYPISP